LADGKKLTSPIVIYFTLGPTGVTITYTKSGPKEKFDQKVEDMNFPKPIKLSDRLHFQI